MPQDFSFDVVSQTDMQEVNNAIQQARKELGTRFDFKGSKSEIDLTGEEIVLLRAFVTLDSGTMPTVERIDGVNTVKWRDSDEAFALSGDVPAGELLALAQQMIGRS